MTKRSQQASRLFASALRILTEQPKQFTITDWRNTMPKALADDKAKAMKATEKKLAAKGVTRPKHTPAESVERVADAFNPVALAQLTGEGLDANLRRVVESKHVSKGAGATTHRMENTMTDADKETLAKASAELKAKKEAEKAEKLAAKEAAKAAKEAEKAELKAKKDADAAAKKAEREAAKAAKDAERKAAAEARAAERAERAPRERNYTGSMLTLADRVASGQYVKGKNGQLRSGDAVALALEVVPAKQVVGVVLQTLGLESNPYDHLNYGQQSMNLRNRLRGAIKSGAKIGEGEDAPTVTLERLNHFVSQAVTPAEQGELALEQGT